MTRAHIAIRPLLTAALIGLSAGGRVAAQEVHPTKSVFADAGSWPVIAPGEIPLANFRPFRAVYERAYLNGAGESRHDRVVITGERVAWYGTPAILVTLVDAGNVDFEDTSPRTHVRIFAEEDQRMLHQISPVPGTPHDHFIIATGGDSVRVTHVADATGEGEVRNVPGPVLQLGAPALWLVGSMTPEEGATLRFHPADLPAASSILHARPFLVRGRETVDAGPLGALEARAVDYPLGMADARAMRNYVIDRPPYIVAKRSRDLETGEPSSTWSLRLIELTLFEDR